MNASEILHRAADAHTNRLRQTLRINREFISYALMHYPSASAKLDELFQIADGYEAALDSLAEQTAFKTS